MNNGNKHGQISVNKAFLILYVLVILALLLGPELFSDKSQGTMNQLAVLMNGGFLLIVLVGLLHIFFLWREKKKR